MKKRTLLTRIAGMFKREATETARTDIGPRFGSPYDLYVDTTATVATVYCCVNLLAESVANLPLQYMRLRGGVFTEDTGSRLHYLLTVQPDPNTNAFDFWSRAITQLILHGNAYIVPVWGADLELSRLVLCDVGTVQHDTLNDTYTICDACNAIYGTFAENAIIHLKGPVGRNSKHGVGVLAQARRTISIAQAGDQETLKRFESGGNMRAFVTNMRGVVGFGELQDDELRKAADYLTEQTRLNQFTAVPSDVQVNPYTLSSSDMQFLESRKFTVREICRFFRVHPSFVFDDTSNNYKSAEMANVAFLTNTLNPLLRKIEIELHRKLVPESLCCKRKFQFDRRGLYACDLESKMKYYTQLIATGIHTINELRQLENMPPVADGDRLLVSANLKGITDLYQTTPTEGGESNDEKDTNNENE